MKKIIYCLVALLFLFPMTTIATSNQPTPASIDVNTINVSSADQNVNSGSVDVTPGEQLQLHVSFNYTGGAITDYSATYLKIDAGDFNDVIQQVSPQHFEKSTDTQAFTMLHSQFHQQSKLALLFR